LNSRIHVWDGILARYTAKMLKVLLIRHADPVKPSPLHVNEYARPLTTEGARDALKLVEHLKDFEIDAAYSSPYLRAIQTIEPIAHARDLKIQTIEDLREHTLSPELIPNWKDVLESAWLDFDFALPGGETMKSTQSRGMSALETIRARHPRGTVIVGGHGTLFSLVLHALKPQIDCAFHLAMPMPAVYRLEFQGSWRVISGPGL
jgi:2,3-bisphosphoglycerate-dependent phosphoglycerate mutase